MSTAQAPVTEPSLASCLDAALDYAAAGYPVFPLRGKQPLTEHGFKDASRDADTIRGWWTTWPEAGIGIPTGSGSELVVLDVDPRHGGDASLKELEKEGPLPPCPRVKTGGGGWHYWFSHPGGTVPTVHGFRPGLDLQADAAYVVVPPSPHPSGGVYTWQVPLNGTPLPLLPPWLLKLADGGGSGRAGAPVELGPDGKLPHGRHHETIVETTASLAARIAGLSEERLVEAAKGALGPLLDDLDTHDLEIREAARSALAKFGRPAPEEGAGPERSPPAGERSGSQATLLADLGKEEAQLFHDEAGELYGTVTIDGHEETHRLRSKGFHRWLTGRFFAARKAAPSNEAVTQARTILEYEAQFKGQCLPVFLRVAEKDGELWIDLGDSEWRAVRVTRSGWSVEEKAPVRFVRGRSCLPFPLPERGGDLTGLRPFLRATSATDPHFVLSVAWILGAFHPKGPYPILCLNGEQGTGKSSSSRFLRALTDPSALPLRSAPKEERDLCVAGNGNRVVAFDNLSTLPSWLSDALCRLSTGGGFGTRQLYTDDDEAIFSGTRPVLLNGIPILTDAGDLRDRALLAAWPILPKGGRRRERELAAEFRKAHPRLFGAVLDALSAALAGEEEGETGEFRMADFAAWVLAAEKGGALPWPVGTFARVYAENIRGAEADAVGEEPLAGLVRTVAEKGGWRGTTTQLLDHLAAVHTPPFDGERRPAWWPKTPRILGNALRRLAPSLRSVGVSVEFNREGKSGARIVSITQNAVTTQETLDPPTPEDKRDSSSASSASSATDEGKADDGADEADGGGSALRQPLPLTVADAADAADAKSRPSSGAPPIPVPEEALLGPGPTMADRALANSRKGGSLPLDPPGEGDPP